MTRRDYCGDCQEMVGDNDVGGCDECGHTHCYDCIIPYDYKTALFAMNGRVTNCYSRPPLLAKEIKPFFTKVDQMIKDMATFRLNIPPSTDEYGDREHFDSYMVDFLENDIPKMFDSFVTLIGRDLDSAEIILGDDPDLKQILDTFTQCFDIVEEFDIYKYVCFHCHERLVREQCIADLKLENEKLRKEIERMLCEEHSFSGVKNEH